MRYDKLFIGGEWVAPATTATIEVISPHTEQVIARVAEGAEADIDRAVAAARRAFDEGPWPRMTPTERSDAMAKLLAVLQGRSQEMATTITAEMGSPITFSHMGQVMAAEMVLDYYVRLTREFAFEEVRPGMMGPTVVRREPVGVCAAIIPWNIPFFIAMLKLGPAMAAGATAVLKPAPETPLDAVILAEAIEEAGLPKGVINIVPAGREVGECLVKHPQIDKVTFTGSTAAGRRIAALCGKQLKRVTLELGGKSAAMVLDDVNLEALPAALVPGAMMNSGQACAAQTRILASRRRYQDVVDTLVAAVKDMPVGDPMDPMTMCGPLVSARQRDRVEGYIRIGREEGATIAIGGGRPPHLKSGWYVEPTILTRVDNSMRVAQEEIFGPVVVVIPYDTVDDAVRIANDSTYGLSGSVWTTDIDHGLAIARRVRTGNYTVNGFMVEFASPFGGFKCSGIGRELGPEGLAEFLEAKSINLPMGYEVP
jgi:betaine-aldehyde dehydrogenase